MKRTLAVLLSAAMVFGQTGAPVYADTPAQAEDPQASVEDAALSAAAEEDAAVRGENASPEQSVSRKATASNAKKATGSNAETASGSDAMSEDAPDGIVLNDVMLSAAIAKTDAVTVKEAAAEDAVFVLMNIPYEEFYETEAEVDSITSATLNGKARNVNVNGASYHQSEETVTTEGIRGAMYPVRVSSMEDLKALGGEEITDATTISYEMNVRGQMTTFTLTGIKALQEAPDYSYYILSDSDEPKVYKELHN